MHVFKAWRSWKREGEQPIKPSGQHRAWLGLLTSRTGEEAKWNSNDQGVARVLQGTPRFYILLLLLLLLLCMYVCMYVCTYVYTYVCTYICMTVWIYECMYVCIFIYVCMYVLIGVLYAYIRVYVCVYLYICGMRLFQPYVMFMLVVFRLSILLSGYYLFNFNRIPILYTCIWSTNLHPARFLRNIQLEKLTLAQLFQKHSAFGTRRTLVSRMKQLHTVPPSDVHKYSPSR
jgi:nuclear pore complex protein Nup62